MALKENDVNWFRPLWRRVAVVIFLAVWLGWEVFFTGEQIWMILVGAALAYSLYNFFYAFPKEETKNEQIPLLVRSTNKTGKIHDVTPASAGWTHVGFGLHKLAPGEAYGEATGEREVCLVLVSGKGRFAVDGEDFGELGERMSPFEGAPWALYVPAGRNWAVDATTDLELAVCSAPGGGDFHAKAIAPGTHSRISRGKGANVRHVYNIMPEDDGSANALLVVEVITPEGNTSSYPPHKHDQDNLPHESQLEETYYHRINPPQGFAFQRVYTDDRSLDEAMAVEDGDVTLVPRGYHPVATTAGYDLYYLNVMAGPKRVWKFHNAPEHEWLLK